MRSKLISGLVLILILFTSINTCRAEEAYFDSNGVKIRYLTAGNGETVILIHGFAVPSAEFMWIKNPLGEPKVMPELARDFRVVALDLRGHGKSGKPLERMQYGKEMVEDVIRLMDHLKVQRAHVVGYSLGAIIAGNLMVTHPDRLLSVTLGGGAPVYQPTAEAVALLDGLADSLDKGNGVSILVDAISPAGEPKPSPVQSAAIGKVLVLGQNQKVLAQVIRGIKDLEVTEEQLRANKLPVLFVYGSREGEARDRIERMIPVLGKPKTEVIKGGDHMTTFAAPKFRKVIHEFLKAHRLLETGA